MKKWIAPILFLRNLFVILAIWWQHASVDLISLGRFAGLLAFYLILWQLLLIGRISWIESVWGHDRLSRWHHRNGIVWALGGAISTADTCLGINIDVSFCETCDCTRRTAGQALRVLAMETY